MKITIGELKQLIKEATGGDGKFDRVDGRSFQHLEVGNTYIVKSGRSRIKATFVGWVTKDGQLAAPDIEDPNQIDLRFADVDDGMEWEAYWYEGARGGGAYAVGSSADTLFVKETF